MVSPHRAAGKGTTERVIGIDDGTRGGYKAAGNERNPPPPGGSQNPPPGGEQRPADGGPTQQPQQSSNQHPQSAQQTGTGRTRSYQPNLLMTTTETVPGHTIGQILGIARGNTVEARNVGSDMIQSVKNITGGELKGYSELATRARDEAIRRAEADAHELGADAVVNLRLATSEIIDGGAEVVAYGTAVQLE